MKNNKNIVIFFCVVGLFISAYLSKHYVDVNINESSQSSICSVNKFFDCDELTKGAYSSVFKIPLSVYSFVFFIFIIFRTLVYYEKHRENALFCPFLFGLVCSITMFSISLFVEGKLCPFCSVLYLIHLLFFIKVFSPPSFLTFKNGFLWEIELIKSKFSRYFLEIVSTLFLIPIFSAVFFNLFYVEELSEESNQIIQLENEVQYFIKKPQRSIAIKPTDLGYFKPENTINVVLFTDYLCPYCKALNSDLKQIIKMFSAKTNFVFKEFPLDSECNRSMEGEGHVNSCKIALISKCLAISNIDIKINMEQKSRFEFIHDLAYMVEENDPVDFFASNLKLSKEEVSKCLNNEQILRDLEEDIELGIKLRIDQTPSIYVNGNFVKNPDVLKLSLILKELEKGEN